MADCLYQCLKEARLEKYFRNFVNGGLQHCESLLQLSMQEYPRYGVVLMEDRLRLFKLIQIVKSVQAEGMVCKHGNSHHVNGRPSAAVTVNNNNRNVPVDNILRPVPLQVQQIHTSQSHIGAPQRVGKKPSAVQATRSGDSPVFHCRKTLKFTDSDTESDDSVSVQLWDTHNNEKWIEKQSHSQSNNNAASISEHSQNKTNEHSHSNTALSNGDPQNKAAINNAQTSESVFLKSCEVNGWLSNGEHAEDRVTSQSHLMQENNRQCVGSGVKEQIHEKMNDGLKDGNFSTHSSQNKENIGCNHQALQGFHSSSVSTVPSGIDTKPLPQAFFISTSPVDNSSTKGSNTHVSQSKSSDHVPATNDMVSSSQIVNSNKSIPSSTTLSSSTHSSRVDKSHSHMFEQGVMYRPMSNDEQRLVAHSQAKPFHFKNFHPSSVISGGQHSYFPATNQGSSSSTSNAAERGSTQVEKVYHNCGYTYGVPSNATSMMPSERKHSSVKPGQDKIRVCVRKRPRLDRELKSGEVDIVKPQGMNSVLVEEAKMTVNLSKYLQQHVFKFDEVFGESCDNQAVYDHTVKPLIQFVFNRGSATCFAFGQTGSGKSYTLLGASKGVPGLYQLAATDIFSCIDTLKSSPSNASQMHLWASYYEIYCSHLFDLLNKRKKLHVRENNRHKVCIVGLMETEVHSVKGLVEVVQYGNASRSTGVSGNNSQSSRSHAVLQLEVRDAKDCKVGRLSFIDLAGSERATDMIDSSDRQTRIEGAEINQSLLALKECIRSLDQESGHTPYRQSKLTHILRDSFIGNSHTVMIANVSPCISSCVHTLNTLKYADRVKELKKDQEWKLNAARNSKNIKPSTPKSKQNSSNKTPSSGHTSKATDTNCRQFGSNNRQTMMCSSAGGRPFAIKQNSTEAAILLHSTGNKDHTPDKATTPALFMGKGVGMQFASTPKSKGSPNEAAANEASPFDVSKILREESDTPIRGHKIQRHDKEQKSSSDPVGPTRLEFNNISEDFEIVGGFSQKQKQPEASKNIQCNNFPNEPDCPTNDSNPRNDGTNSNKIFIGADKVNELIRIQKERLSVGKEEDFVAGSDRSRSRTKADRQKARSPQAQWRSKSSGRVLEGKRSQEKDQRRSKSIEKGLSTKNSERSNLLKYQPKTSEMKAKTPESQMAHNYGVSGSNKLESSRSRSNERVVGGSYPIKSHDEIMAEHKEVLDHLDSLLDRAKAAITESPSSSPTSRQSEFKKQFSVESTDGKSSETRSDCDNKPLVSILKKTPTSEGVPATFLSKSAGKEKITLDLEEDFDGLRSTRHSDPLVKNQYYVNYNEVYSSRIGETASNALTIDKKPSSVSDGMVQPLKHHSVESTGKGSYHLDNDIIVLDDSSEGRRMDSPCIRPSSKKIFPIGSIKPNEQHAFGPSRKESFESSSSKPDPPLQRSASHGSDKESERSNSRNMSWHDILSQSNSPKDNSFTENKPVKSSRTNSRDISFEMHEERHGFTTKAMIKDIDTIVIETDVPLPTAPETGRSTGDSGFSTSRSRDPDKFGHSLGSHRSTDNHSDTDTLDDVVSLSSAAVLTQETETNKQVIDPEKYPGATVLAQNTDNNKPLVDPAAFTQATGNKGSEINHENHGGNNQDAVYLRHHRYPESVLKSNNSQKSMKFDIRSDRKSLDVVPPLKLMFSDEAEDDLDYRRNLGSGTLSDRKVYDQYNQGSVDAQQSVTGYRDVQSARDWTDKHKGALHIHHDSAFTLLPEGRDSDKKKRIEKPQAFELPAQTSVPVMNIASANKVKDSGAQFSPIESFPITPREKHVIAVPNIVSMSGTQAEDSIDPIGSSHKQVLPENSAIYSHGKLMDPVGESQIPSGAAVKENHFHLVGSDKTKVDFSSSNLPEPVVVKHKAKVNRSLFPSDTGSSTEVELKNSRVIGDTLPVSLSTTGVKSKTSVSESRTYPIDIQKTTVKLTEEEANHVGSSEVNQLPAYSGRTSGVQDKAVNVNPCSSDARSQPQVVKNTVDSGGSDTTQAGVKQEILEHSSQSDTDKPKPVRPAGVSKIHQAQEKLMMQHEEQLTKMTALCKQEMKLLMASRMTQKGFPEYVRALEEILSDKGRAILLLKSKIDEYVTIVNNE